MFINRVFQLKLVFVFSVEVQKCKPIQTLSDGQSVWGLLKIVDNTQGYTP